MRIEVKFSIASIVSALNEVNSYFKYIESKQSYLSKSLKSQGHLKNCSFLSPFFTLLRAFNFWISPWINFWIWNTRAKYINLLSENACRHFSTRNKTASVIFRKIKRSKLTSSSLYKNSRNDHQNVFCPCKEQMFLKLFAGYQSHLVHSSRPFRYHGRCVAFCLHVTHQSIPAAHRPPWATAGHLLAFTAPESGA